MENNTESSNIQPDQQLRQVMSFREMENHELLKACLHRKGQLLKNT